MAMGGAHADPRVAAIFKSADLAGGLTYKMFTDGGSPGTWGNVQQCYKEHVKQHEPPPATPAGAAGRTSSGKRTGAKEAGGSGCAGGSSAAK